MDAVQPHLRQTTLLMRFPSSTPPHSPALRHFLASDSGCAAGLAEDKSLHVQEDRYLLKKSQKQRNRFAMNLEISCAYHIMSIYLKQ